MQKSTGIYCVFTWMCVQSNDWVISMEWEEIWINIFYGSGVQNDYCEIHNKITIHFNTNKDDRCHPVQKLTHIYHSQFFLKQKKLTNTLFMQSRWYAEKRTNKYRMFPPSPLASLFTDNFCMSFNWNGNCALTSICCVDHVHLTVTVFQLRFALTIMYFFFLSYSHFSWSMSNSNEIVQPAPNQNHTHQSETFSQIVFYPGIHIDFLFWMQKNCIHFNSIPFFFRIITFFLCLNYHFIFIINPDEHYAPSVKSNKKKEKKNEIIELVYYV